MNTPMAKEIRDRLAQRRERDRAEMGRHEEAMDAFAVDAVRALTQGLGIPAEDGAPATHEAAAEAAAVAQERARRAIEVRRLEPMSAAAPSGSRASLQTALRGVVAAYAEPLAASDPSVAALEALSGNGLGETDSRGTWADRHLEGALAVRAALPHLIDMVTARAESVIIAELVDGGVRLSREYPDAPRPYAGDLGVDES